MLLHKPLAILAAVCVGAAGAAPACGAGIDGAMPGLRMPDPLMSLRDMYPDIGGAGAARPSTREYQPVAADAAAAVHDARGNLPLTSAWQRLGDFRSANGIRLVTLWQAAQGSIALHEGRHGGVSLQWTSHDLSRGAATRGLFDHLVSTVRASHTLERAPAVGGPAVREPVAVRTAFYP